MTTRHMKSNAVRVHWRDVLQFVRTGGTVVVEHYAQPIARIIPMEEPTVTEIPLPPGIHAEILTAEDAATLTPIARAIVWADRITGVCDTCGEPIPQEVGCPVSLNGGSAGRLDDYDQKHGCGAWQSVLWAESAPDEDAIARAAAALAAHRDEATSTAIGQLTATLRGDLAAALARLAEPLAAGETREEREDEVTTGSDIAPGIYLDRFDSGEWVAWDTRPGDDSAVVTVYASDLA